MVICIVNFISCIFENDGQITSVKDTSPFMSQNYTRILLIDDDVDDQEIFLTAISRLPKPLDCTALGNARDALHQLKEKHLSPDLIFLDLNMPIMSGQQFLVEFAKHEHLVHIPVIVLSTTSHEPTIQATRDLGASDFITKPNRFDDLVSRLHSVILAPVIN